MLITFWKNIDFVVLKTLNNQYIVCFKVTNIYVIHFLTKINIKYPQNLILILY